MIDFEIAQFGPACQTLLADVQPGELGPGSPHSNFHSQLEKLDSAAIFSGQNVVDRDMAACCESGLWLLHNYLDESHRISQEIQTPTGSYWHGIMHRREPDFSNAKYWFRRAGDHPIFASLHDAARQVAAVEPGDGAASFLTEQDRWDPAAFVDLCESVTNGRSTSRALCLAVAEAEWQLLFEYCFTAALGNSP